MLDFLLRFVYYVWFIVAGVLLFIVCLWFMLDLWLMIDLYCAWCIVYCLLLQVFRYLLFIV